MAEGMRARVREALDALERKRTRRDLDNLDRFGISATKPFGVSMANLKAIAKRLGRDHDLAAGLWATGRYEARLLAAMIDEPERVTAPQMDRWARDFDNWAVCDTACFLLFDRTPHAYRKVGSWSRSRHEFVKRAAFALLASLALHDREAPDARFARLLPHAERGAGDARPLVRKGVSWALRSVGRRSPALRAVTLAAARRLAASGDAGVRWVGKDTIQDLARAAARRRT
jgi:3-methyladenine DNA glycosylase AlkD